MENRRRRCWQRVAANLPILLIAGDKRSGGTVLDLSRSGARLRLPWPLEPGADITLTSDRLSALGARVIWRKGDEGGVAFVPVPSAATAQIKLILDQLTGANFPRRPPAAPRPQFGRRVDLAPRRN